MLALHVAQAHCYESSQNTPQTKQLFKLFILCEIVRQRMLSYHINIEYDLNTKRFSLIEFSVCMCVQKRLTTSNIYEATSILQIKLKHCKVCQSKVERLSIGILVSL